MGTLHKPWPREKLARLLEGVEKGSAWTPEQRRENRELVNHLRAEEGTRLVASRWSLPVFRQTA